ncbi:uncharacterized protein UV8b_06670 [Ustilaginoidea virens]|uniref:Palmitoyltransferase n=1 Tax=Ustilaginoidea virens TaxID=1159556 RepID=A0A8E5HVK3_USTVR|nr:uncharacterized protein UV8b_06670 [Ustilaginoidea virens]QUC22429.1 hypothetical protein UV8b_06670 [Ustilaginoidea virens]
MPRRLARTIQRTCCVAATYVPLVFVYGLTTWAIWMVVEMGFKAPEASWLGTGSSTVGVVLYVLLNWSYTTAVFTDPGSTTNSNGYGLLPTAQQHRGPCAASFTVKSNGEIRYCKKCQARKPDRAHHCSTCRRCVLKMDHHCPWLATCLGLRNYKPFLLFLVYTTLLCLYAFAVSGTWVWSEVVQEERAQQQLDDLLPVGFILLSALSGIMGVVIGVFTGWHVLLATRGQTTIECLERTRYLSPLKQPYHAAHDPANRLPQAAQQFVDFHANALPGITRPEEGEEEQRPSAGAGAGPLPLPLPLPLPSPSPSPSPSLSWEERERRQGRRRYEEYLDEQDSTKLPNAFDLGWRRNLLHLLGSNPWLWGLPICNTTGDGWSWEASPRWLEARARLSRERQEQRAREVSAGWGLDDAAPSYAPGPPAQRGLSLSLSLSKADRILGRDANMYADGSQSMPMQRLSAKGRSLDDELLDTDDEDAAQAPAPRAADDDDDNNYDNNKNSSNNSNSSSSSSSNSSDTSARRAAPDGRLNGPKGRAWTRGGASGMLRKPGPKGTFGGRASVPDEGVD